MRQCVLPVERGGVEGCVGDAEAEEVFVATIPLIFIILFFILVFITFSTNINRIATARNVLNGTLGQSGPSAGFEFEFVAKNADQAFSVRESSPKDRSKNGQFLGKS